MNNKMETLWDSELITGFNQINPTPKDILLQQAEALKDITSGVVIASVDTHEMVNLMPEKLGNKVFEHSFVIKSPKIGFRFTLMNVSHELGLYPLNIHNLLTEELIEAKNEIDFKEKLSYIFNHEKTKNAINVIYRNSL